MFLQQVAAIEVNNQQPFNNSQTPVDTQIEFDAFYTTALSLLNQYYPERTTTVTSRDPEYVTPEIKAKLRRKNRLMRAGRVEEAAALAERIGKDIARRGKARLSRINGKTDAKEMWAAVRQLTGRRQEAGIVAGITAESLNEHYAAISTDANYTPPLLKHSTATSSHPQYVSAWQVFRILDSLHPTATGLDQLPAWFLRLLCSVSQ